MQAAQEVKGDYEIVSLSEHGNLYHHRKAGGPEMHPQPPEAFVWFVCEDRADWERARPRGHTPAERIRARTCPPLSDCRCPRD